MATIESIQNELVEKILSINNKDVLLAIDKLVSSNITDTNIVELTHEQKMLLEMSEEDIRNGNLISQEAIVKRNLEWLNSI